MQVELITIGDELMLGFTVDTNAAHLSRALAEIGVSVSRRTTVGDDERDIAAAVAEALGRVDGVVTTGGLGPTSDDRSKPAVASVFGRALVLHEGTLDALRARWAARGLGDLPETNRQQAVVPQGAELLPNAHGSAPGIWIESDAGKWVAMLPGVPREMRGMLADALLPRLRARDPQAGSVIASRVLRTTGVAESRIADLVGAIQLPHGVTLAYLPGWEGVDLRVTVRHVPPADAEERLARAVALLRAPLGEAIYGERDDDLAAIVLDSLRARQTSIAVAESCTGGMLGARLTAVPRASSVVRGGVIAYDNAVKVSQLGVPAATLEEFGAVSLEVARAMAAGVRTRLGADVGVGITGIAGPGGAVPGKPVGTVCIAVAAGSGSAEVRSVLVGDRHEVRQRATQAALMMVRRVVEGSGPEPGSTAAP